MKELPIGVFDSGLGGLTIVRALRELLPNERVCYYGDTAHLPYGDKSPELIRSFCAEITRFLLAQPVKAIVIACNTASAVALDTVREIAGNIPVFDVIHPAAEYALQVSSHKRIGIIGTKTTVATGVYRKVVLDRDPLAEVVQKATPMLVPMIEEGWLHNQVSQDVIDAYMSDTGFERVDTLILGCTHYPLIKEQIQEYFQRSRALPMQVVDSSLVVANRVKDALSRNQLLNESPEKPECSYFVSDVTAHFQDSAKLFLGEEIVLQKV